MAFVNTIDIVGDEALVDSILDGSITEFRADYNITIGPYAFTYCEALASVDLVDCDLIDGYGFHICSVLKRLVLRNNETTSLANTNCLTGTLIKSGTGYIYVPRALVDSYKAATNWSTYADQFRALEDYTVDGTTTGDLDETKI